MNMITKISSVIGLLIFMLVVSAIIGVYSLSHIGNGVRTIAREDIPLSSTISQITTYQLEQTIWLGRSMLSAELDKSEDLEAASFEFNALSEVAGDIFINNSRFLVNLVEQAENEEAKNKYLEIQSRFKNIEVEYIEFVKIANELLGLLENGDIAEGENMLPEVEEIAEVLIEDLQALNMEIGQTTEEKARSIDEQKTIIQLFMVLASIVGIIFAATLGVFIIRSIVQQLGADPKALLAISEALAKGELDIEREKSAVGVYGSITSTVDKLVKVIAGIQFSSGIVSDISQQVAQGNANLSSRTQAQASSLEQVSSSMEEMTNTVSQNAENAEKADQLAIAAREQANKGGVVVEDTVSAMNEVNTSSNKIADIIEVIDDIAFQTNLLALNAAVEAARAGEQGRGFAVVANEVRNLAARSAVAAKEIKELIDDSVEKVKQGKKLVDESGDTLKDIVNSVKEVSDIVAEITVASKEQSESISQVNKALSLMEEMTHQNASLVEEAAASSESMGEHALQLSELVSFFKLSTADSVKGDQFQRIVNVDTKSKLALPVDSSDIKQASN